MNVSTDPFWGKQELRSRVYQNYGKGNWFAARPRYIREIYGEAAFSAVASSLSGDTLRYFLKPPMAFSWLPIKLLYDIDYAIVQGPMQGRVEEMQAFGAAIASYDLNWLYRAFLTLGSPEFLLRQSGLISRTYIKETTIRSEVSNGSARLVMTEAPLARYLCKYGVSGWIAAAVQAAGGRDVEVDHFACLHLGVKECEWSLRWRL